VAAILEIDAECNRLNSELLVLDDAKTELARQQQAEAEAARQKEQAARQAEGRKIASEADSLAHQVDQEMVILRGLFERRASVLRQLEHCGLYQVPYLQRLVGKYTAAAAARAAGLDKHLTIEHVLPPHVQPLATNKLGPTNVARFKPRAAS
jgi:hypothetical protein